MTNSNENELISVVVCTYNRCEPLAAMLQTACELAIPADLRWELLVVDNNSTDETRAIAERYREQLPIRYIFEPRQGKTIALNRAVHEATGSLLIFTDDDVRLDPDWLSEMVRASVAYPDAGWFGGRVEPYWPAGRPAWLRPESLAVLGGFFVTHDLGDQERRYGSTAAEPIGANMAVRRETFERIGLYREDLGPSGERRGTHDDSELIWRAREATILGVYVPTAHCEHLVAASRSTWRSFFRYGVAKGENQARVSTEPARKGWRRRVLSYALRAVFQACKLRWDRVGLCIMNIGLEIGRQRGRSSDNPEIREPMT